jgi:hypothetical protein
VVKYAIRFTVLVCPGFTFHWVMMTTGVGQLLSALSATLGRFCTMPESTPTVSVPGFTADR